VRPAVYRIGVILQGPSLRGMLRLSRVVRPGRRYADGMTDEKDRDLRISLKPLTGEEALRALLQVDPDSEPVEEAQGDQKKPPETAHDS
jgi:hypothetical protein